MNNSITTPGATGHRSAYLRLFAFLGLVLFFSTTGIANTTSSSTEEHLSTSDFSNPFCNIRVWFKNRGCKKMEIFRVEDGRERHKNTVNANGTAEFDATKGDRFIIKVAGKKIKDWKVPNCKDQTQMIDTKGCDENCHVRIGFKNTGCNRLNIFTIKDGKERQVGHINPNETTHVDATKGQKFRFRTVEGGKKVKDWTANSCNASTQKVDSGDCACKLRVWFKNRGCASMEIFRRIDGKERHAARVNANGTAEFDATKGDQFIVRVNGKRIKDWKVPNCDDQTQMIDTKGCDKDCRVRIGFKNTGCNRLNIFSKIDGRDRQVGHINPNETTHVDAIKDQRFWFKTVEGGRKVKDWKVSKCENSTQKVDSGDCAKKPDCGDIKISTSKGKITVKGLKKAPISEVKIMTKNGKQVAGCRKCNKDTKTFRVDEGDYWVIVTYSDKSWKRICETKKDVHVRNLTDGQDASTGRVLIPSESTTINKPLAKTQVALKTQEKANRIIGLESQENLTTDAIKVYPNPANAVLFVDISGLTDQQLDLNIVNAQGAIVRSSKVSSTNNTIRFDLSTQPAGIYLVRLQSHDGLTLMKKIIVQ